MIDILVPCECVARELEHFIRCEANERPALPEIAISIDDDEVMTPTYFADQFFDDDDPLRDAFEEWHADLMVGHQVKVMCNAWLSGDDDLDNEYVGEYGKIVKWGWIDGFWETDLYDGESTPFSGYQLAPVGCDSKPIRERSTFDALTVHAMLRRAFEQAPPGIRPAQLSLFGDKVGDEVAA